MAMALQLNAFLIMNSLFSWLEAGIFQFKVND